MRRRQLGEAGAELRRAVELAPGDMAAHYNLGRVLEMAGNSQEGRAELAKAREQNVKAQNAILAKSMNNSATRLLQERRFSDAAASLLEAKRLNPDDSTVRYNLGVALIGSGKLDEGIAELREALRMNPDQPDAYYYLGSAWLAKGQPADAVRALGEAIRLNPDDARAHNARAVGLADLGRLAEAREEADSALSLARGEPLFQKNADCLKRKLAGCRLGL